MKANKATESRQQTG